MLKEGRQYLVVGFVDLVRKLQHGKKPTMTLWDETIEKEAMRGYLEVSTHKKPLGEGACSKKTIASML